MHGVKYEQSYEDRRFELAEMKREITKAKHRINELDTLFKRVYEDNAIGKLSDERFKTMSSDYDSEQQKLKADVALMEADVAKGEEVNADLQLFLSNIRKYTDITALTPTVLNEFIKRIEIHAPEYSETDGKRTQEIEIFYNAVGVISIPTTEELDEMHAEYAASLQQKEKSA